VREPASLEPAALPDMGGGASHRVASLSLSTWKLLCGHPKTTDDHVNPIKRHSRRERLLLHVLTARLITSYTHALFASNINIPPPAIRNSRGASFLIIITAAGTRLRAPALPVPIGGLACASNI
jgi:hypothetical protein